MSDFRKWVQEKGFTYSALSEQARKFLAVLFQRSQTSASGMTGGRSFSDWLKAHKHDRKPLTDEQRAMLRQQWQRDLKANPGVVFGGPPIRGIPRPRG